MRIINSSLATAPAAASAAAAATAVAAAGGVGGSAAGTAATTTNLCRGGELVPEELVEDGLAAGGLVAY